jgi:hypothetical protein
MNIITTRSLIQIGNAVVLSQLLFNSSTLAQNVWRGGSLPFLEKYDLSSGARRGYATLAVSNTIAHKGDLLAAEVRFFNQGEPLSVYNAWLNTLKPLPLALAVYDANTNYVGNILSRGVRSGPGREDWLTIPSECSVGSTLHFGLADLSPGEYYLQAVFNTQLIATSVDRLVERSSSAELFRSNPVKVTIRED